MKTPNLRSNKNTDTELLYRLFQYLMQDESFTLPKANFTIKY